MSFLVRLPRDRYESDAFERFESSAFALGSARATMWLSQLAYEDKRPKIESVLSDWGLTLVRSFGAPLLTMLPIASTAGIVATGKGRLFVSFKGTDPLVIANWITNFDFIPDEDMHRGFAAALDSVWFKISDVLAGADLPVVLTGHSLGGALAVLAARRMEKDLRRSPESVYVFGAPRCGTQAFADAYDATLGMRTYRFVHGNDIVPTVPPPEIDFHHVGRVISCPADGRFAAANLSDGPSDEPAFAQVLWDATRDGLFRLLFGQVLPPGIADHLPDRYCRALR